MGSLIVIVAPLLSAFGDGANTNAPAVASLAFPRTFQTDTNIFVPNVRHLVGTNEWKYELVTVRSCLGGQQFRHRAGDTHLLHYFVQILPC